MWTTEHSRDTTVARKAIWRAWADVEHWPEWNAEHRTNRAQWTVRDRQHDRDDAQA